MIVDLDEPCWEGRHANFAVLGGLMLAFYVVGFPLLALVNIMRMHARAVEQGREIHGLKGYLTWGLFVSAYHPKVWWWESTVAVRKIVIAAIGVFGTEMGEMQIHLTLFLMVIVMLMTAVVQPFGNHLLLQLLELGTLGVTWATLWAGSVFNTHPRCEDGKGGTLGWCNALSVVVSVMVITSVVLCISIIVYYTKQGNCNRCWGKHVQARINRRREQISVRRESNRRERMESNATMFDNPFDKRLEIEMTKPKTKDSVVAIGSKTIIDNMKKKRKQKMKKIRRKLSMGSSARRSGSLSVSTEGEQKTTGEKSKRKSFRKIENEHGVYFQDVVTEDLVWELPEDGEVLREEPTGTKRKSFRKIENEHGVYFQDVVTEDLVWELPEDGDIVVV